MKPQRLLIHWLRLILNSTEVYFTSSEALVEHLGKATGAKELIKRYQRRALAINGLVLLIQRACAEGDFARVHKAVASFSHR